MFKLNENNNVTVQDISMVVNGLGLLDARVFEVNYGPDVVDGCHENLLVRLVFVRSPLVVRCLACSSSFRGDVLFLKRFLLLFFRKCKCKMFNDSTVSLVWSVILSSASALLWCFMFSCTYY